MISHRLQQIIKIRDEEDDKLIESIYLFFNKKNHTRNFSLQNLTTNNINYISNNI